MFNQPLRRVSHAPRYFVEKSSAPHAAVPYTVEAKLDLRQAYFEAPSLRKLDFAQQKTDEERVTTRSI